jgi:iron(III) transport system permease protein
VEAARTLGVGGVALFRRVALPLARPAVAVGVALVLLETLNDVGASEFLGVKTLTVAVYTTWITRSDLPGAAQLACAMLAVVAVLLVLERAARRRQRFAVALRPRPLQPQALHGTRAWLATFACALPVLLGFVAPALHLAVQAWERTQGEGVSPQLLEAAWNTVRIALVATAVTLAAGLLLAFALRLVQARRGEDAVARAVRAGARVGAMGYAIPGTVLAIALLAPLSWFDDVAARWSMPLLMGSSAALVLAYVLRFTAIPAGGLESGYARVPIALDQSARSLGAGAGRLLARVHLPLMRPAMGAAALLVFVDAMKELPATLLLRPLGFESLATWLYGEAARGTYEEGAVAALLIVLAGLPAVLWMHATLAPRTAAAATPERSP